MLREIPRASELISGEWGARKGRRKSGECLRDKAGEINRASLQNSLYAIQTLSWRQKGANEAFQVGE